MFEISFFIIIAGFIGIMFITLFQLTWIDPRWLIALLFLLVLPGIYAAFTGGPFVPSARKRHKNMLALAELKKTDTVYDLGCGDGRLLFSAAPFVKQAIGYDLSIPLVLFGKLRAIAARNLSIRFGNLWKQNLSEANVIFCYLLPASMERFHKEVWPTLKKGTRVVSNAFPITGLRPKKEKEKVYLYIR